MKFLNIYLQSSIEITLFLSYFFIFFFAFLFSSHFKPINLRSAIILFTILINSCCIYMYYVELMSLHLYNYDIIVKTPLSLLIKMLILFFANFIYLFFFIPSKENYQWRETLLLIFLSTLGYIFAICTDNLLAIYVSLEISTIANYALIINGQIKLRFEAGIKYFFSNIVMSVCFLFAILFFYENSGTVNLHWIISMNTLLIPNESYNLMLFAFSFLTIYFLFKMSIVPLHIGIVDIYQSTSPLILGYFSIITKIVPLYFLIFFIDTFHEQFNLISNLYLITGSVSLIYGTFATFLQSNIKRFFAYSSITHIGLILLVLSNGNKSSIFFSLFFNFFFLFFFFILIFSFF